ncbi:hypothetical protein BGZ63DRAFT_455298 [Mariannaea sp. PMI_226]|nr:hypothetical protein BGZ63DRAFT_455298 [Mariannaea sp. PMI_226]
MVTSQSDSDKHTKDEVAAGKKHQIEHESPDKKRTKTEENGNAKKQKSQNEDDPNEQSRSKIKDIKAPEKEKSKSENGDGAVKPSEETDVPSNALEKGIVYFFIRGRVNIDEPEKVEDIARSYMLIRPIPKDARLGEGPIADAGTTRLVALPKKVFPTSPKDRFMAFVDMSHVTFQSLKDNFLASSEYETKTAGTRHKPAATPIAEGVYAITSTGRESHFAYILTLPEKLDEVQQELGLRKQGSFIISTKNPKYPGPANARLPKGPEYPKEIRDDFGDLRWKPSKPEHLDYVNTQILLIGEPSGIDKATERADDGEEEIGKNNKDVLENLEEDDLDRMKHLGGDASESIFADLHVRAEDYPAVQSTFSASVKVSLE